METRVCTVALLIYLTLGWTDAQGPTNGTDLRPMFPCGGHLVTDSGIVASEGFPSYYKPNTKCIWYITVPEGHVVMLSFRLFDLEADPTCRYDYLDVFNGHSRSVQKLGRFCGTFRPGALISTSNTMMLEMVSDEADGGRGFLASFNAGKPHMEEDQFCGGRLTKAQGSVNTPNWPDSNYPAGISCSWHISVEPSNVIEVKFEKLDLEPDAYCRYDYVALFNGGETDDSRRIGKFCGDRAPGTIVTNGNELLLQFVSDLSVTSDGFKAHYSSVPQGSRTPTAGGDFIFSPQITSTPRPAARRPIRPTPKPTSKPAKPTFKPAKPTFKPAKPTSKPAKPMFKPAKPTFKPTKPMFKPAKPTSKPIKPVFKPAKPTSKPAKPMFKPIKPVFKPAKPTSKPAKPMFKPAKPTSKPTHKLTSKPTPTPTSKTTPKPTYKPTPKPTLKPTPKPTPKPILKPTTKPSKPTPKPPQRPRFGLIPKPTLKPARNPSRTPLVKKPPLLKPTPKPSSKLTPKPKPTKPTPKPPVKKPIIKLVAKPTPKPRIIKPTLKPIIRAKPTPNPAVKTKPTMKPIRPIIKPMRPTQKSAVKPSPKPSGPSKTVTKKPAVVKKPLPLNPQCTQPCKRAGTLHTSFCPHDFVITGKITDLSTGLRGSAVVEVSLIRAYKTGRLNISKSGPLKSVTLTSTCKRCPAVIKGRNYVLMGKIDTLGHGHLSPSSFTLLYKPIHAKALDVLSRKSC
ncbi:procollagen C-endopeptidase enhancer 2-like [Cololabis saira]|uniref:procollagen C-endopeptidase enhancer 2-like n=1 Tax=Cololabis saira TaxID=129043 RepID=UPI002AD541F5|nr:procollagen C-endopeptidase enhancer 2-like [Cololabis saira]